MSVRAENRKRKFEQILEGARTAFLELGFEGTSMDEVTRRACVSKPTVYSHFKDKNELFTQLIASECHKHGERVFTFHPDAEFEAELLRFAGDFVDLILSPDAQAAFRIVIAESGRFPEIGQAFYKATFGANGSKLIAYLQEMAAKGALNVTDAELAARQLIELCRAEAFYRVLLRVQSEVTREQKAQYAANAVKAFMAIYGTRTPAASV
jgi:TetR/AcrR family transcriptional regulator, mexJK operon transcriptional repressor